MKDNRFIKNNTAEQAEAYLALSKIPIDEVGRVGAVLISPYLQKLYTDKLGLKQSSMSTAKALHRLAGKKFSRHQERWFFGSSHLIPGADHVQVWLKGQSVYSITSQPYGIEPGNLIGLVEMSKEWGVDVSIDAWGSWWFPGKTILVEITKKAGA